MNNTNINKESFSALDWIISDASRGFFFVLASHKMQERIAKTYTEDNIAKLNYSDIRQYNDIRLYDEQNTEHYRFRVLNTFADDNPEKKIFFILNFQIPFPVNEDIYALNFSRDWIADKNKVWIFFMTAELEERLFQLAPDFHSYCNMKVKFEDSGIEETKQELLNLSDHIVTIYQTDEINERLDRYKDMEEEYLSYFETAPDGTVRLIRKDSSNSHLLAITNTLENIAKLYDKKGDYENALKIFEKILLIREKILGVENPYTAASYNNIGFVYRNIGDYNKALEYYNKALEIQEKVFGLQHPDTATSYNNIGAVYDNIGDYNKALEYYNRALEVREKVLGVQHSYTANSYNNIGNSYNSLGDYDKAIEYHNKALKIREKLLGLQHPDTADSYNNIGAVYDNKGNYNKALEYYNKALEIQEKVLGLQHPYTAISYNNIGVVYYNTGDHNKALECYNKALEIYEKVLGKEHPDTKTVIKNIEILLSNDKQNNYITMPYEYNE